MSTTTIDSEMETCKGCSNSYKRLLTHISQKEECKEAYGSEFEALKKERNIAKKRKYNKKNRDVIKKKQAKYNKIKRISINSKQRIRTAKLKDSLTKHDRFVAFKQEIMDGPSFVCYSCDRALFQRGVSILQENDK